MKTIKNFSFLVVIFIIPSLCLSYTWENFGPADVECNNFNLWGGGVFYEIISSSDGLWINIGGNWEQYHYSNLPVWDTEQVFMATADLIVAMGEGTYSDGIYFFNFITFEFFISEWFLNPRFIYYCWNDSKYYVGGEQGLMRAEVPSVWETIDFFNGKYCYDMVSYYGNYIVSTSEGVYYSNDAGENWYPSNTLVNISDLEMSQNELVYGIFPGTSYSSGLWISSDYGVNWEVEFWETMMSSVGIDEDGNIFVGWEEPTGTSQGVAMWTDDLTFMNNGLPNVYINKLTYHPFLIYTNLICCTDNGTYMLTDYSVDTDENSVAELGIELKNFPNPFNPETTIYFETTNLHEETRIEIYNLKGQKIKTFPIPNSSLQIPNQVVWNGTDENNQPVGSGIYFYKLNINGKTEAMKKCLLLK